MADLELSSSDLHPEAVLDRLRAGDLRPGDREMLDEHTARCATCALELAVLGDFEAEGAPRQGDAARIDALTQATMDALAAGALAGGGEIPPLATPRPAPPIAAPRRWTLSAAAAAALALVLVGSGGAAAAILAVYVFDDPAPAPPPPPAPPPERGAPPAPRRATPPPMPPPAPAPEPEVAPAEEPDVTRPRRVAPPEPSRSASELLRDASAARRRGELAEAASLYRELQGRFPSSRETAVSRVAYGRLLLDQRGDAAAALAQFDRYLAGGGGGALAEEARAGRALSLARLGRQAESRAAWRDLLTHHPDSVHAERARRAIGP